MMVNWKHGRSDASEWAEPWDVPPLSVSNYVTEVSVTVPVTRSSLTSFHDSSDEGIRASYSVVWSVVLLLSSVSSDSNSWIAIVVAVGVELVVAADVSNVVYEQRMLWLLWQCCCVNGQVHTQWTGEEQVCQLFMYIYAEAILFLSCLSMAINDHWSHTKSEKSSIITNRKSTACFPMSLRWTAYVACKQHETISS